MIQDLELKLSPENADKNPLIQRLVSQKLGIRIDRLNHVELLKRSVDGRSKEVMIRLQLKVYTDGDHPMPELFSPAYCLVHASAPRVLIVGAGPAGLFAALRCLQEGVRPVLFERGKEVSERKKDVADLNARRELHPDSNYCFGEGGAGTFSDGKLYTRSSKRGNVRDILQTLVLHGADKDILVDAHPHIGSDRLPRIIEQMRQTILSHGGEIHFDCRIEDILLEQGRAHALLDAQGKKHYGDAILLATGHSADDIYHLFDRKQWALEAKGFAVGVRVEHPQGTIDTIQYHTEFRSPLLPPAIYTLTTQAEGRGVFSFCMCPGGIIVPALTRPGTLVVNGMSNADRNSPYANAGLVVTVDVDDYSEYQAHGALAGLYFRDALEKKFFEAGGGDYTAPAQKVYDFVKGRVSAQLLPSTYNPGLVSKDLHSLLPEFVAKALRTALYTFNEKMRGFLSNEAQLIGLESRTSSPVRIPRKDDFQHVDILGLYPCGEGAGYSGGIVSSALDGWNAVEAMFRNQKMNISLAEKP